MTTPRCADASVAAGESLAGTAAHVERWLLVETREPWPRDVASALDPGARAVRAWLDRTPSSRLLFIRRPGKTGSSRRVFVARASATEAEVRRLDLSDLADLADLDGRELDDGGERVDPGLVLVCGHGSRDACCALRGTAVFTALAGRIPPDELWLSSHQGGHRFAANVLVLPGGIQLGRLDPTVAPQVVVAAREGEISLEHFRGRTSYPARAQVADIAVRQRLQLRALGDVALVGDDGRVVELIDADGRTHRVVVEETVGPRVPASCGVAPEPQLALRAVLA